MGKITTILFDCDNTLVLSESLAFEGCADLINEIARSKNVNLREPFTGPTLLNDFVGQNFRGMIKTLQGRYGFEMTDAELEDYVTREEDVVINKIKEKLVPCNGVSEVLEKLGKEGQYKMAVVSSSALRRVKASIERVGQDKYFGGDVYSAATSLKTPTSKPDPAIYLHAMDKMGVKAEECIAVEDSRSGTLSGTRAGIKVVGYVGPYDEEEKVRMRKDLKEAGAVVIMEEWSEFFGILERIQKGEI